MGFPWKFLFIKSLREKTTNMTEFILNKLETGWEMPEYRWSSMLNLPGKSASNA